MLVSLLPLSMMFAALAGIIYLDYRERVRHDRQKIVAVVACEWLVGELLTNDE